MKELNNNTDFEDNNPNLVLVSEEFPPFTPGGIATYQKTLSSKLSKNSEMGKITVICKATQDTIEGEYNQDGVRVIRIKGFFEGCKFLSDIIGYKLKVAQVLLNERKINKIDVIESPEWNQELFIYYLYNLFTFNIKENKKIALRLHTPLFVTKELNNLKETFTNKINILMEKFLVDNVETVTACSKSLIDEMGKYHSMRKDISIIHNPGNDELFQKDKELEDIYNLQKKGNINILFAGSLEYRKGIDYFCKAMKKILDNNPLVSIVLSGKYGDSENANSKLSKEEVLSYFNYKDKERIKFLGLVPYENMPNVYKYVDICIFPSIYDNYPGVVIESLLMGKAVIGSQNTGIKEAIHKGIIYIDPTDVDLMINETQELLDNPEKRIILGEIGFKEVKKLNNAIIAKFVNYYSGVAGLQIVNYIKSNSIYEITN